MTESRSFITVNFTLHFSALVFLRERKLLEAGTCCAREVDRIKRKGYVQKAFYGID